MTLADAQWRYEHGVGPAPRAAQMPPQTPGGIPVYDPSAGRSGLLTSTEQTPGDRASHPRTVSSAAEGTLSRPDQTTGGAP